MAKGRKKSFLVAFLSLLMIMILTSCGPGKMKVHEDNMEITLTKDFQRSNLQNATWYYKSKDALVMGVKVDKLSLENDGLEINSASDYAALYIRANDIPGNPVIKTRDKYVYYEYTKTVSNTAFAYLTSVYDHGDSYWMVNFACYKDAYPESSGDFFKWADSVVFDNE